MTFKIENDIQNERIRQINLWGIESHLLHKLGLKSYLDRKIVILTEELGELCKEINDNKLNMAYVEAIQVAAVAKAICEGIYFAMENKYDFRS